MDKEKSPSDNPKDHMLYNYILKLLNPDENRARTEVIVGSTIIEELTKFIAEKKATDVTVENIRIKKHLYGHAGTLEILRQDNLISQELYQGLLILHRLRNKAAHNVNFQVPIADISKLSLLFKREEKQVPYIFMWAILLLCNDHKKILTPKYLPRKTEK